MVTPSIQNVKGHQDKHAKYAQLPLKAQHNVNMDAAATEYQTIYGHCRTTVPMITGNGAQFVLQGKTVTHHYIQVI
jgi:hypothetical protein